LFDSVGTLIKLISMQLARTSENDPITVDFIPLKGKNLRGKIGMTFAPGKKAQGMHVLWDRNLREDLSRLKEYYQTDVLITLIEKHEFSFLHIDNLFRELDSLGIKHIWFPIKDESVPDSLDIFMPLVKQIIHLTSLGNTVIIHCRAGLGRTGMVVACCLVALGYAPKRAIEVVRNTREYTIETEEQEEYITKFSWEWLAEFVEINP
jgi:protein-tyrosine phosphatase